MSIATTHPAVSPAPAAENHRWFHGLLLLSLAVHAVLLCFAKPWQPATRPVMETQDRAIALTFVDTTPAVATPAPPPLAPAAPVSQPTVADAETVSTARAPATAPAARPAAAPLTVAESPAAVTVTAPAPAPATDEVEQPLVRAQPAHLVNPPPAYPRRARQHGWQGTVRLRVLVRRDGTSGEVALLETSGFRLLDDAAMGAVRDWQFTPARRGTRAVDSWAEQVVEFRLDQPGYR